MTPAPQPVADERLRQVLAYADNYALPGGVRFVDDALRDLATAYRAALVRVAELEQQRNGYYNEAAIAYEKRNAATARAEAAEARELALWEAASIARGFAKNGLAAAAYDVLRAALTTEPTT